MNIIIINHNVYCRYYPRQNCSETHVRTHSTPIGTRRNRSQNDSPHEIQPNNTTYMTDRTRYDRTEEEAPLVPLIPETERQPTPYRPTTGRRTGYRTAERTETLPELTRELRTLRAQLDRIEATLQDDR